ncbi:hypothetical protein IW140_003740 [Coemansia sp. RSA 1813]|nr:hypothetical protein EV178_003705 [Coemansia sp. RSA 1646]KAJ1768863.1 hypothetical protein LPJ74_004507 [Coemansia sp. RSA 1843]KAJ2088744.1 hypothetical protein IW138_004016 [Coemansia sp. RSA 986]KAJ2213637.1 hypothetical protein EV179_003637 [Coemansia sp. RSA 487]KAJ2568646.1 hypothetical protein IW140_003740 [Coemansia sp. RSA 1813]
MGSKDGYYSQTSVHSDSDDSGELWITPKVPSRVSTHIEKPRSNTLPTQIPPLELRQIRSATEAATTMGNSDMQLRRQLTAQPSPAATHSRRHNGAMHRSNSGSDRRLSLAVDKLTRLQMVAWYAPRILFLFFVGWSCSIGVQLIHAQQRSLDATIGPAAIRPFVQSPASATKYADTSLGRTSLSTDVGGGAYDSGDFGDSDVDSDSDTDAHYRNERDGASSDRGRKTAGSGKRTMSRQGSSGLSRDLIGRVLEHASWSDGISGAMGIAVGLAYPYLDWKWQSYLAHKVEWNDVLRCAGGFLGINYAALKLPFESANQSSLIMVIISLGLWTVCDGTLHGLLLSTSTSLMATWLLHMHALSNYASFTQDDYQGLLSYLPSVLFTYCVMVGSIGRRLGHHPLWKRYRHQHFKHLQEKSSSPSYTRNH